MGRFLKIVAITLVSLVVLVALGLFALTQFIDPNSFKPDIEQMAHDEANLTLDIKGDLAWSFWPSLGISIGETEVRVGDSPDLFAGVEEVKASVAVWPLFSGNVQVGNVLVDGIKLHLVQNKDGANWEQIAANNDSEVSDEAETAADDATAADQQTAEQDDTPLDIPVTIPRVEIRNGHISYDDHTSDTHINITQLNLSAEDVNLQSTDAFPVSLSLRFQDPDNRIDLSFKAQTSLDSAAERYRLTPMTLDADIKGPTAKPVSVHLKQNVDANLGEGVVAITDMLLTAAGINTSGEVTVSGLSDDKLVMAGRVKVASFNANKVLKSIGATPIETADANALSQVAVDLTLGGPANSVMIDPLVITLDDSTIKGNAGLANLDSGKIVFDLAMDSIVLDGYLPPNAGNSDVDETEPVAGAASGGEAEVSQQATKALSTDPILADSDLQSIKALNLDGKFTLANWQYDTIKGKDLTLTAKAANGKVDVATGGSLLDGSFDVASAINASGKQPSFSARGKVAALPIGPLVELATDRELLTGTLRTSFKASARGNSEKQLMESASANYDFGLIDSVLKGANLNAALAQGVSDMLGKYQGLVALIPESKRKPPRGLSKDTRLTSLTGDGTLKNQVAKLTNLKADLKDGELTGNGWLNINSSDFEFNLGILSPKISSSPYLKDTRWPIRCAGNLDGEPKHWCGPDKSGLDKIAKDALASAAKQKVKDRLGIDAEGDSAGEVIKNAAKKKADETIKDELNKGLKKLFR